MSTYIDRLMFFELMSKNQEWDSDSTGNIDGKYSGKAVDILNLEWQVL